MIGKCRDCIYFEPGTIFGRCRRYPPAAMGATTSLPSVSPQDWCGEFHDKQEALNDAPSSDDTGTAQPTTE